MISFPTFFTASLTFAVTDADFFPSTTQRTACEAEVKRNYFRALRARPPRRFRSVVSRKSSTSAVSRHRIFFTPPRLSAATAAVSLAGEAFYERESARAEPISEPPVLPTSASAAVRHGLNGETRRSESDTLPLFRVPPRAAAGETAIRVCVRTCCACVHSRVLVHLRCNITYSLTTGYGRRIESSRQTARYGIKHCSHSMYSYNRIIRAFFSSLLSRYFTTDVSLLFLYVIFVYIFVSIICSVNVPVSFFLNCIMCIFQFR